MEKNFDKWNKVKCHLDISDKIPPDFKIREVWWCSVGMNVGFEIYGKNSLFTRPVLILHRYSKQTLFGIPLSSKRKEVYYRFPIKFKGIAGDALIDQGRSLDAKRLVDRMGRMDGGEFNRIKKSI